MATPRKRWFKVADSILREPWDDRTLATAIRLMAWLNQRWQRDGLTAKQSCEALIGEHDAMLITRLRRGHEAVKFLSRLPLVAGWCSASAALVTLYEGRSKSLAVHLKWPKYAEFQGATARKLPESRPRVALSDSDSVPDSGREEKRREERADAPTAESPEIGAAEEEAARAKLDADCRRALSVIAGEEGERDEKLLWLRAELRSAESWAADQTESGRKTSTRSALHRWWKNYLAGPRPHRDQAAKNRERERQQAVLRERGWRPDASGTLRPPPPDPACREPTDSEVAEFFGSNWR